MITQDGSSGAHRAESDTTDNNSTASVTKLSVVRRAAKKKARKVSVVAPKATQLGGGIYSISAADGKQAYVWIAIETGKNNKLKVTEVYPGASKKQTAVRDVEEPIDLVWAKLFEDIDDVLEEVEEILEIEDEDEETDLSPQS